MKIYNTIITTILIVQTIFSYYLVFSGDYVNYGHGMGVIYLITPPILTGASLIQLKIYFKQ